MCFLVAVPVRNNLPGYQFLLEHLALDNTISTTYTDDLGNE